MKNFLKGFFPPTKEEYMDTPTAPPWAQDKRVLFLDDDPAARHILEHVARRFNMILFTADSVANARTVIESVDKATPSGVPPFDVMILDIVLTNGSGIELYQEVHVRWPDTHVVFLTGYDPDLYRKKVEQIGLARIHSKGIMIDLKFVATLFRELGITEKRYAD